MGLEYCTKPLPQSIAGIHVSGPNAHRTAVVVLSGQPLVNPLELTGLYEKIGPQGKLFSDERVVDVLKHEWPLAGVFVDCPLSLPPCVACQRARCPGVIECEDVAVAYMLALSGRLKVKGARKKRPINPQSQRLWDVAFQTETDRSFEPTYSANLAPLVVRARTLQRRLNDALPGMQLKETSVYHALRQMLGPLGMDPSVAESYRGFERGKLIRSEFVQRAVQNHWLAATEPAVWESVDVFHALITAMAGSMIEAGLTQRRPMDFLPDEGWVYLPEFAESHLPAWPG